MGKPFPFPFLSPSCLKRAAGYADPEDNRWRDSRGMREREREKEERDGIRVGGHRRIWERDKGSARVCTVIRGDLQDGMGSAYDGGLSGIGASPGLLAAECPVSHRMRVISVSQ
ncbi:hypothetical protein OIDMADRAFT_23028 [Oidiodendron maius Zn]|uniref:Uncharacterized protein n=1 Tax=Oidiodendron maius (strain Zn) TaxID=913774 RepID=A0A0C3HJ30_OIDMZ|nr:hypothetical protein OIDMADRAFT_23028 [Oidiodendron maius Zn]